MLRYYLCGSVAEAVSAHFRRHDPGKGHFSLGWIEAPDADAGGGLLAGGFALRRGSPSTVAVAPFCGGGRRSYL